MTEVTLTDVFVAEAEAREVERDAEIRRKAIIEARDLLRAEYQMRSESEITNSRDCLRLAAVLVDSLLLK
jgi:hypothetical protein